MPETNRIEYKAQLTKDLDLEKEVVAFLNYHEGGLVYIGIDKNGNTLGVEDPDADMLKIKDRIKNNIAPSAMGLFDVDLVEQLGSGIPRILETYGKECFQFSANFLRMVFPSAEPVNITDQVSDQATNQVDWQSLVDTYSAIKNGAEPNQVNFLEWLQTNIQIILHELQESFRKASGKDLKYRK